MTLKRIPVVTFLLAVLSISCSVSVAPVYNRNEKTDDKTVKDVDNREDLKAKAVEDVKLLHRLIEDGKFEEAHQMIDDNSPLKLPKPESIKNLQEIVDELGKLENLDLTRDNVVTDQGQLQVRQEFIVKFEKDTPTPKRYELFIWNVYPDNSLKLWKYINSKGDD